MSKMVINKKILTDKVANNLKITKKQSEEVCNNFLLEIKKALRKNNSVSLNNFAVLSKSEKVIDVIYSPIDGTSINNKTSLRVNFLPSKNLKAFLKVKPNLFLLATHNKHKLEEFRESFPKEFTLISLDDLNDFDEIEESGLSYKENATLKAKYFYEKYLIPTISDDSGFEVEALNNRPGIYSRRYSGGSDYDNNQKILKEMENENNRNCAFKAVICLYEESPTFFEGTCTGTLARDIKSKSAFGYDPVFIFQGKTRFSDLSLSDKNKVSHRGKAIIKLVNYLKNEY